MHISADLKLIDQQVTFDVQFKRCDTFENHQHVLADLVRKTPFELNNFVFYQQQNLGQRFGTSEMHLSPLVAKAAVHSKAVVLLLLLVPCLVYYTLVVEVLCWSLFCCELPSVLSSFAIILKRKRELVALVLLTYGCLVTVNVL